ncbi:hypothetical protein HW509_00585 [Asaia spathodeae]
MAGILLKRRPTEPLAPMRFIMGTDRLIMVGHPPPTARWTFCMPLTFVYLIGMALSGVLAFFAPHYQGLAFVMTALFSIQLVPAGLLEAFHASHSK